MTPPPSPSLICLYTIYNKISFLNHTDLHKFI